MLGMKKTLGARRNRLTVPPVTLVLVALAALNRLAAQAQTTDDLYPYVGCFVDSRPRLMSRQIAFRADELTLAKCAAACLADADPSWKYAGLEFGQECFCGDVYDTYGEADNCNMYYDFSSGIEAGGRWAMSVYNIQEVATNSAVGQAVSSSSTKPITSSSYSSSSSTGKSYGAGGDTVVGTDSDPVESGKRSFTVKNECSQTIRIGSTGGRITFGAGTDSSSEGLCDAFGSAGVYNSGPNGIGCYWDLPPEDGGNTDRMLGPGESFRYNLHETEGDVRWSGTVWASTGCDEIDGCATGVCYSPDTDYVCPAYVGPGGPTTKAEFTLSDSGKDYYDVSNIDGANLPMMIEPDNPIYPEDTTNNILKYECGSPGSPNSPTDLADCEWAYEDYVPNIEENLSQFLRLVLPEDYENPIECESDADCAGITCGVHPERWANGAYKGGVLQGACGEHVAWVSAGGACAGGWTTGEFPDNFPYYCGESVTDGQRANMYGCHGGALAHSGYTPGADSSACGCPDWESELVVAPPISECEGINPEWLEVALPWAKYMKKACPTAYTFPYDDQTSTFMCQDLKDGVNTQSCECCAHRRSNDRSSSVHR